MDLIFLLLILLFSVVVHEVSHGFVAEHLGDPTARLAGRLTLNPIKHLDPFGSVILPLLLSLVPGGVVFGWAKPVPYNPMNLKNPERSGALIAVAGPLSNISLALVFAAFLKIIDFVYLPSALVLNLGELFSKIVLINIALAVFNLVPLPPLDGSKVLFALLPKSAARFKFALERSGMFLLLLFIFFGFKLLVPVIVGIYHLLT